ncbi:hypothetical protein [Pseudomonas moraviensis]|uniref:Uncharacterized protein n=1 Tax=Pseudomonas moraviensis TaxID=321662 RepID=A0A7Y9W112_9PSED|nr:hypothetical protein [Pseudomonas moraviensis]NYH12310.1 hypothetical protein [Pseudomonas moraviensis]
MPRIKGERYSKTIFKGYKSGEQLVAYILRTSGEEPAEIDQVVSEADANDPAFDIDNVSDPVFAAYFLNPKGEIYEEEF